MTSAMITLSTPWPRMASRMSATRIAGNDSWMSTMRIKSASIQPPKYAAARPTTVPMASAAATEMPPTIRLVRRP